MTSTLSGQAFQWNELKRSLSDETSVLKPNARADIRLQDTSGSSTPGDNSDESNFH